MKEYFGKSSAFYKQTKGKRYLLMPAIRRAVPKVKIGNFLDIGCGRGDFCEIANRKGYRFFGLDISKDMISYARAENPAGEYSVASAKRFSGLYSQKFDVLVASMLLPAISGKKEIVQILKECQRVLKRGSRLILGVTYPPMDHYMQSFLFNRKEVKTKFTGYYASGSKFATSQEIEGQKFVFEDYHWTLQDYFECIGAAGLRVEVIDECPPDPKSKSDKEFYIRRNNIPTYLVIVCTR